MYAIYWKWHHILYVEVGQSLHKIIQFIYIHNLISLNFVETPYCMCCILQPKFDISSYMELQQNIVHN